jgi:hypothetical protein
MLPIDHANCACKFRSDALRIAYQLRFGGTMKRAETKTVAVSHRVEQSLRDDLQALADLERRSLTNFIEVVLAREVDRARLDGRLPPKPAKPRKDAA